MKDLKKSMFCCVGTLWEEPDKNFTISSPKGDLIAMFAHWEATVRKIV
jgi:hypothetical protein